MTQELVTQELMTQELVTQELVTQELVTQELVTQELDTQELMIQTVSPLCHKHDRRYRHIIVQAVLPLFIRNYAPLIAS